jgi:predicted alpha-1,6-mannanase (GH76 family)
LKGHILIASKAVSLNMTKRIILFVCLFLLFLGLRIFIPQPLVSQVYPLQGSYRSYANNSMAALQGMYNPATGHWFNTAWWQEAEALETVIDYSSRTHTTTYTDDIATTFNNNKYSGFLNKYYDDEGWWALTWIKAYDLTGKDEYLNMAKFIFNDMTHGWDRTCGGGLWWTKDRDYKNAIPNELFLSIAARLHQRTPGDTIGGGGGPQRTSYIDWANKEWRWFKNSGMINSSHLVNDGLEQNGNTCQNNGQTPWTYNQGVILGALTDMYSITGLKSYLGQAEMIADANIITNRNGNGILYEMGCEPINDCDDDALQFKGIFVKNLYYLYQADHKQEYKEVILKNARAICTHDRDGSYFFGLHWDGPFEGAQTASQSSALDTINAAMVL